MRNWYVSICLLTFWQFAGGAIWAQSADWNLVREKDFSDSAWTIPNRPGFLLSENPSPLLRYNPISLGLGAMMYFYQRIVSPQFSAGCLYHPSCSQYSKELIGEYGFWKGILVTADRISRCNRIAGAGIPESEIDPHDHKVHESVDRYSNGHVD